MHEAIVTVHDGREDIARAAAELAERLPAELAPLARLAYNYRWSWLPGGAELYRAVDAERFELTQLNPVRTLQEASLRALRRAAGNAELLERAATLEARVREELEREPNLDTVDPAAPVAFLCAEYAVHQSLPVYSGGLGVLAGDLLKEASDRRIPLLAVGLMYRKGYFRQRIDAGGWQHEYWVDTDPERVPAGLVTEPGSDRPLTITVPIGEADVTARIWRVEVGRVPLFLLDTDTAENGPVQRWITARLYEADPDIRLAQYVLLGAGGIRALRAMGIEPGVVHLNEGHAALAPLELARGKGGTREEDPLSRADHEPRDGDPTPERDRAACGPLSRADHGPRDGDGFQRALAAARARTVFTTHTPVPAGNDCYPGAQVAVALRRLAAELGAPLEGVLALGRTDPQDPGEPFGVTQAALRMSRAANAVSARHGSVARAMWSGLWPGRGPDEVPIGHVTNGVHLPSWIGAPMRALLDRHLGERWRSRTADPEVWEAVERIPDAELWEARERQRAELVEFVVRRSVLDRLGRGEVREYVEAAAAGFDAHTLTLGFARRVATYKRLELLTRDPDWTRALLTAERPIQVVLAGKAHPRDEQAKRVIQRLFSLKDTDSVGRRVVFLDDYDLATAARLVQGCDVWVNLPRPPLEASGTSGMKSAINGGLQLSVLDGWWSEAFDGGNGWALPGEVDGDTQAQDERDTATLHRLLEQEVVPMFYDRDHQGRPAAWLRRVRASLRTLGPRFSATRMLRDYLDGPYRDARCPDGPRGDA